MDVRCERCRAQYVFDDDQVTSSGITVQCTNCGHVFKVKKKEIAITMALKPEEIGAVPLPAKAAGPRAGEGGAGAPQEGRESARDWHLRQANGNLFTFRELTTLQKWIIEQKVTRDDEISHSGEQWKRLGNIAELASFFQVVEAAERGKALAASPAQAPVVAVPAPPPAAAIPAEEPRRPPPVELDWGARELAAAKKGRGGRLALAVILLVVAGGAVAYVFAPQLFTGKPKAPAALAIPTPVETKPAEPALPAAPAAPAPAEAPVPGAPAERATEQPPAPTAKPEPKPAAAPRGPKAMLAQAARLREKGNVDQALDLYGRVADDDPENVEALAGRGSCYLDLEKYPLAEAAFKAALQVDSKQPDALLGLAEAYRWQRKKADAIKYYEKYLAVSPEGEDAPVARNALEELRK